MGREDVEGEGEAVQHEPEQVGNGLFVSRLDKLNLNAQEIVALMGSHTLGFQGQETKGFNSRWVMNPYVFDNTYFKELLLRDKSKYFKTEADVRLVQNPEYRNWVEAYAEDQDLFFRDYAAIHSQISERGHGDKLLSEIEPDRQVDGGYQEENTSYFRDLVRIFVKEE